MCFKWRGTSECAPEESLYVDLLAIREGKGGTSEGGMSVSDTAVSDYSSENCTFHLSFYCCSHSFFTRLAPGNVK